MRITKKMTAFLLAFLMVLSPVTALPLTTHGFATPELVLKTTADKTEILPGDTVTIIIFSLDQTVSSQGFGLEYTFDQEAFEWVDGEWSEEIDDEAMLADVSETAAVFAAI